ncbi:TadE family protein [Microbacterium bovistercoris]|uniref:TadE family protein n=1 Tax=Microbacterium bovistercoris TaxID=2293570 RepID=A0A371NQA0_9MICO|nr:TadE family protein [Microbacterium bovistercoris]REJ04364.1 TadE family protein [Microbacterium bovistercoris]
MRRWRLWVKDDEGSAALEFITAGILLLVPLVYLVIALGAVQEQTLGAEAAARHTARAISQATDQGAANARADAVLASVRDEYGMDDVDVALECLPAGDPCPRAGATVIVRVSTRVALPFMPPVAGLDQLTAIPIEASAAQKASRLWGAE